MSTKFLHIPRMAITGEYDEKHFTNRDLVQMGRYLPHFLANIKDEQTFARFLEKFPEVCEELSGKDFYQQCLTLAAPTHGPLAIYLANHVPDGINHEHLMKHLPEPPDIHKAWEVPGFRAAQVARNKTQISKLRLMSKHKAGFILAHTDEGMEILDNLLSFGATDDFTEMFSYLTRENQEIYLKRVAESDHQYIIESPDALASLIYAAGPERVKAAYLLKPAPRHIREIQESWLPDDTKKEMIARVEQQSRFMGVVGSRDEIRLSCACKILDQHAGIMNSQYKPFLNIFSPKEREEIFAEGNFRIVCRTIQLNNPDGFRLVYNAMDDDQRAEMFSNRYVLHEMAFNASLSNDLEFFRKNEDILPPKIINFAIRNYSPPDIAGLERISWHVEDMGKPTPPPPEGINKELFENLLPLITIGSQVESGHGSIADDVAITRTTKLATLFENFTQVDRYLANMRNGGYGSGASKKPIHDACLFSLPDEPINKHRWAKLIINFGPAASKYLSMAPQIDAYAEEHGLPLPKTPKELANLAKYLNYERGDERTELAAICQQHGIPEWQYNRILDLLDGKLSDAKGEIINLKTNTNIPAVTIDGADIGHPGYVMEKLDITNEGDKRMTALAKNGELTEREVATILGELSHCCQSVGAAGEKFTLHGMTSENGDFYVWKKQFHDKPDQIVAQSWVWRADDEKNANTLVFDSIEPLGNAHNDIFADFMIEFTKRVENHGISQVNIGKGGKTPTDLPFVTAEHPANLSSINFYDTEAEYDSQEQWIVKQSGSKNTNSRSA